MGRIQEVRLVSRFVQGLWIIEPLCMARHGVGVVCIPGMGDQSWLVLVDPVSRMMLEMVLVLVLIQVCHELCLIRDR